MEIKLSPQTIEALAFVISGGSANDTTPMVGLYRSGPKLERFMRSCNVDLRVGSNSRLPALTECLIAVARGEHAQMLLPRIIEAAADPRDFLDAPEKLTSVVDYLNKYLGYDGLELQRRAQSIGLVAVGTHTQVIAELADKSEVLDFDTVCRDLDCAVASAEHDPEDAVTAACSTIESMCRSILLELGIPLPQRKVVTMSPPLAHAAAGRGLDVGCCRTAVDRDPGNQPLAEHTCAIDGARVSCLLKGIRWVFFRSILP